MPRRRQAWTMVKRMAPRQPLSKGCQTRPRRSGAGARAQMNFAVGDLPRRVSSVSWVRSDCVRVTLQCKRHMLHPLP